MPKMDEFRPILGLHEPNLHLVDKGMCPLFFNAALGFGRFAATENKIRQGLLDYLDAPRLSR